MVDPTPEGDAPRSSPPEGQVAEVHQPKRSRKAEHCPPGMDPVTWRAQRKKEAKERRLAALKKAQESIALKRQQRALVKKKVEAGLPITEQERELLNWSSTESKQQREKRLIDSVAKLVITPKTVEELRLVVEQTAARYGYNPIEALIKLTGPSSDLDDEKKMNIHKALLPFLVPQVPVIKAKEGKDPDERRVKVTVTQFVFPERPQNNVTPLHKERPKPVFDTSGTPAPQPEPSTSAAP